jgi:hypothetical protein
VRVGCARLESYCGGGCESEAGCCEEAEEEVGGEHFGETDCLSRKASLVWLRVARVVRFRKLECCSGGQAIVG